MSVLTLIDGKLQHCGQICRILRAEQREAFKVGCVNAHREIRDCFDVSYLRKAILLDSRLVGLGGIAGPLLGRHGYVWLALSDDVRHHPIAFARMAKRLTDAVHSTGRTLDATIVCSDERALRFAYFLGFRPRREAVENRALNVLPMRLGGVSEKWLTQ